MLLTATAALSLNACGLGSGAREAAETVEIEAEKDTTPALPPIITVAEVSVNSIKRDCDTIRMGDTIQISAALDPLYNTITAFDVRFGKREFEDSIFSAYDYRTFCDTLRSDPASGHYEFRDMEPFLGVFIPRMQFRPLRPTRRKPYRIALELTTDVDSAAGNKCVREFSVWVGK